MRGAFWGAVCAFSIAMPSLADDNNQGPWPENCRLTEVASLPMTVEHGQITIPVRVNGTEKTFLLDTGGYASGLSPKAVQDLGLTMQDVHGARIQDVGGKVAQKYVRTSNFGFGQMQGESLPLLVSEGLNTDGVLAPDLLRNFDVELDFANEKLNLFHHHPCDGRAVYWATAWAVMDFDVTHDGHIRVPVTLDGEDTHAIVDTGATFSDITMGSAEVLFGLSEKSPGMEKAPQSEGTHGSIIDNYTYPFKSLTMGGVTVSRPIILIGEHPNLLKSNQAKMLLGLSVIRRLHMYIAYKEGKLYITGAGAH
jgi:predicted aspartyl protease